MATSKKAAQSKPSMRYTGEYEEDDGSSSTTYRDTANREWIQRGDGEVRMHPDSVVIERGKRVGGGRGFVNPPAAKGFAGGGAVRGCGLAKRGHGKAMKK